MKIGSREIYSVATAVFKLRTTEKIGQEKHLCNLCISGVRMTFIYHKQFLPEF